MYIKKKKFSRGSYVKMQRFSRGHFIFCIFRWLGFVGGTPSQIWTVGFQPSPVNWSNSALPPLDFVLEWTHDLLTWEPCYYKTSGKFHMGIDWQTKSLWMNYFACKRTKMTQPTILQRCTLFIHNSNVKAGKERHNKIPYFLMACPSGETCRHLPTSTTFQQLTCL